MATEKEKAAAAAINPLDVSLEIQRRNAAALAARADASSKPARGVLDEYKQTTSGQASTQEHTFGEWCRAKGATRAQIKDAVENGRVQGDGDGPVMSEADFDKAVKFITTATFTNIPVISQHVRAEDVSPGREGRGKAPVDDDEPTGRR